MKKIKDILILIFSFAIVFGIIALLMAYSDGLLDSTLIAQIIPIALPALLGAFAIVLNISNWQKWFVGHTHFLGLIFLFSFISFVLCIIFLNTSILYIIAIVIVALTFFTLIIFWLKNLFK